MRKTGWIAVVFGAGLAMASWTAFAQAPAAEPASGAAEPMAISPDQQATKAQLAKLFEVMHVRDQMASVTKMMPMVMQQQYAAEFKRLQQEHPEAGQMTDAQQDAMAKVMSKFMGQVMSVYPAEEMIADLTSLYQKYLTRTDADGIIAFYGSPAGQHMLAMQPVIMKEFMPVVMGKMEERSTPLISEMNKEMEEIVVPPAPATDKPAQK